jgi:hypothetical protein
MLKAWRICSKACGINIIKLNRFLDFLSKATIFLHSSFHHGWDGSRLTASDDFEIVLFLALFVSNEGSVEDQVLVFSVLGKVQVPVYDNFVDFFFPDFPVDIFEVP